MSKSKAQQELDDIRADVAAFLKMPLEDPMVKTMSTRGVVRSLIGRANAGEHAKSELDAVDKELTEALGSAADGKSTVAKAETLSAKYTVRVNSYNSLAEQNQVIQKVNKGLTDELEEIKKSVPKNSKEIARMVQAMKTAGFEEETPFLSLLALIQSRDKVKKALKVEIAKARTAEVTLKVFAEQDNQYRNHVLWTASTYNIDTSAPVWDWRTKLYDFMRVEMNNKNEVIQSLRLRAAEYARDFKLDITNMSPKQVVLAVMAEMSSRIEYVSVSDHNQIERIRKTCMYYVDKYEDKPANYPHSFADSLVEWLVAKMSQEIAEANGKLHSMTVDRNWHAGIVGAVVDAARKVGIDSNDDVNMIVDAYIKHVTSEIDSLRYQFREDQRKIESLKATLDAKEDVDRDIKSMLLDCGVPSYSRAMDMIAVLTAWYKQNNKFLDQIRKEAKEALCDESDTLATTELVSVLAGSYKTLTEKMESEKSKEVDVLAGNCDSSLVTRHRDTSLEDQLEEKDRELDVLKRGLDVANGCIADIRKLLHEYGVQFMVNTLDMVNVLIDSNRGIQSQLDQITRKVSPVFIKNTQYKTIVEEVNELVDRYVSQERRARDDKDRTIYALNQDLDAKTSILQGIRDSLNDCDIPYMSLTKDMVLELIKRYNHKIEESKQVSPEVAQYRERITKMQSKMAKAGVPMFTFDEMFDALIAAYTEDKASHTADSNVLLNRATTAENKLREITDLLLEKYTEDWWRMSHNIGNPVKLTDMVLSMWKSRARANMEVVGHYSDVLRATWKVMVDAGFIKQTDAYPVCIPDVLDRAFNTKG